MLGCRIQRLQKPEAMTHTNPNQNVRTAAFEEGVVAAEGNRDVGDCPYIAGTQEAADWVQGFTTKPDGAVQ